MKIITSASKSKEQLQNKQIMCDIIAYKHVIEEAKKRILRHNEY